MHNDLCQCSVRAQGMLLFLNTGGKFCPGSNFTKLHSVTLATRSYALLSTDAVAID